MKQAHSYCILFILSLFIWIGCEEPFIPDTSEEDQQFVVEGYIEYGDNSNPTFILVTKSLPFIGKIDDEILESIFVHGAEVSVHSYGDIVRLDEFCLNQLPKEIKDEAAVLLGLDPDNVNINICAYVDLFNKIEKREGGLYNLEIKVGDKTLTSTTTIPEYVPLYGFRWEDPPGKLNDTLATLYASVDDPLLNDNYYRYLTGPVNEPLQSPFASVTNDVFFNGKSFEFILNKAEPRGGDIDPEIFGLYRRGDSLVVKWSTLDKEHFDFWSTLEFGANRNGPFASYTRVSSNIEGGLGIWGGYAVGYYYLKVPE